MAEVDDEQDWIWKSRQGDHAAFEALISRYQYMIHSLTFRMTGSQADSEDLAQEAFIHAFRQLPGFRAEARFSSWLYRIAVNLCLNWRKREQRQQQLMADWGEQQKIAAGGEESAHWRQVQEALLKLNPKLRAAVILTTYDGLNHAEAARALGCSETTVSWRLFSARAKLKKLLAGAQLRKETHEGQ